MLLEGVRVVELGTTITAPLAACLLGDFGADVVKVERPGGDPFRRGPLFEAYNRNKQSVVLDLQAETDRARLVALLERADIFIDNLRPGVLERLGVSLPELQLKNRGLIHCSITGFGATGPYAERPAYDAVAQAIGGMSKLMVDANAPQLQGPTISDNVTGMYACIAMLGALNARSRTGTGARLEINMLEATMAFIGDQITSSAKHGRDPQPFDRVAGSQSFIFKCADDRLIAIHLSSLDKFWTSLVKALDAPELETDPRFAARAGRTKNYVMLREELARRFFSAPSAVWAERLLAQDVPFAPALSISEAIRDPQVSALGTIYTADDGNGGTVTGVQSPVLVDGRRPREMTASPQLGEHTDAVFATWKEDHTLCT